MHIAVITPASVACTPDLSTQSQSTVPTSTYGAIRITPSRFSTSSAATARPASMSAVTERSYV